MAAPFWLVLQGGRSRRPWSELGSAIPQLISYVQASFLLLKAQPQRVAAVDRAPSTQYGLRGLLPPRSLRCIQGSGGSAGHCSEPPPPTPTPT